jgi:transposase
MTERRGRKSTGRPRKKPLDKEIENDLIAENQRLKERNEYLEMEIEYLKKLDALVQAREQQNAKKRK